MKILSAFATTLILTASSLVYGSSVSTVNSHNCHKIKGNKQFILVLKKGEELTQALNQCANDAKLAGASLTGIGALENPTLNFYNINTKKYQDKVFPGLYELISLVGNISQVSGKRLAHMHVAISNDKFHVIGGHISKAIVGVTAEITITPFKGKVVKKVDNETGLELIATKD